MVAEEFGAAPDAAAAEMPAPPKGMVWLLRIDPDRDTACLWLYKRSRLTGRSNGWAVVCSTVHVAGQPTYCALPISSSDIESITEAVVVTAHETAALIDPVRERTQEQQAMEISRRLGIKVEVKR